MTLIDSTSAASTSTSTTQTARSTSLGQDFDNFLLLLTTQLQNQDPTAPMDADKFTSQLVQFSAIEQQMETNTKLSSLVGLLSSSATTEALQFIGAEVTIDGSVMHADKLGGQTFYQLPSEAKSVSVRVFDKDDKVVHTASGKTGAGPQTFVWDGTRTDGGKIEAGNYRVEITAVDAAGKPIDVDTLRTAVVDSVDTETDGLFLNIGNLSVPVAAVRKVTRPS